MRSYIDPKVMFRMVKVQIIMGFKKSGFSRLNLEGDRRIVIKNWMLWSSIDLSTNPLPKQKYRKREQWQIMKLQIWSIMLFRVWELRTWLGPRSKTSILSKCHFLWSFFRIFRTRRLLLKVSCRPNKMSKILGLKNICLALRPNDSL
jgi:hypothetical protein